MGVKPLKQVQFYILGAGIRRRHGGYQVYFVAAIGKIPHPPVGVPGGPGRGYITYPQKLHL
jgi:hypothetical protein